MKYEKRNWKYETTNSGQRKSIKTFTDLEVYRDLYKAALVVIKEAIPRLPKEENYSLKDQMGRCCKAPCALLAEGFAKRNHVKSFQKYLQDAIGECNEMIVHLCFVRDLYSKRIDPKLCDELIDRYDKASRQLFLLKKNWRNFV